jgi:hypothetical protein
MEKERRKLRRQGVNGKEGRDGIGGRTSHQGVKCGSFKSSRVK